MTQIIKILKSSIRKNPDYGFHGSKFIEGPTDVYIHYNGNPSKKQLKKCLITAQSHPMKGKPEYDMVFNGSGLEAIKLFGDDSNASIEIRTNSIDVTCKDYGPEYFFKHCNPFVKCTECGVSSRLSDIRRHNDDGYSIDECPRCTSEGSFRYEYEKLNIETL